MRYEKIRSPFKETEDIFGRPRKVKISELCQYCPNENCEGYYRRDAKYACLTFYAWKAGEISLEKAIEAKYRQHERHKRTDPIRNAIFEILAKNAETYEERSEAGFVASALVKGVPVEEIEKRRPHYLFIDYWQWARIAKLLEKIGIKIEIPVKKYAIERTNTKRDKKRRRKRSLDGIKIWKHVAQKYGRYIEKMRSESYAVHGQS